MSFRDWLLGEGARPSAFGRAMHLTLFVAFFSAVMLGIIYGLILLGNYAGYPKLISIGGTCVMVLGLIFGSVYYAESR